jgi:hypothetical protein
LRLNIRPALLALLLFVFIVLPLGMIEGWYGRVDYSGDAIPYLDMAQAMHSGSWKLAFNPLWGLGYAILISLVTLLFPATPSGEWDAIHLLNLLIYTACYASFMFLLRSICQSTSHSGEWQAPEFRARENQLVLVGVGLFLSAELCMDTVSRVGPDTLVTALVLLSLGILLRLLDGPRPAAAIALGAVLGFGYVVKTIFLPLSLVIVLVAAYVLYRERSRTLFRPALIVWTIAVAAFFAVPYIAGLSWSLGRFTMGESGTINYAWHVNRLVLMHWQGGPAQFGMPIHPEKLLSANPPIYGFSTPFSVSYPPFFNPPYYYEGYRHFFSAKLQLHAIAANIFHLYQALRPLPITYAVLLCLLLILTTGKRKEWLSGLAGLWIILVPALAGVALYLQVHLEPRYLPAFLLVISAAPLALFLLRSGDSPGYLPPLVVAIIVVGAGATLLKMDRSTFTAARHHVRYSDGAQWVLGRYLEQHRLHPGDQVAVIAGPSNHCTWAHVDHLHIVAELEADIYAPPDTGENMFWDATPAAQQHMLDLFAQAGAKEVIARITRPGELATPGWTAVPGTDTAVHPLP